jgi:amidohydrolase
VQAHLREIGLDEVRSGVAHTGVVGLLKGAFPGRSSRCVPTWTRCR